MSRRRTRVRRAVRQAWDSPSNRAQILVSVAVAVLYGIATLLSGRATGHWDEATRAEVRWSVGLEETVRHVYTDEAPLAFAVAHTELLADLLRANGGSRAVDGEAATAATLGQQLRFQNSDDSGVLDHDYALRSGGFALNRRLADELANGDVPDRAAPTLLHQGDVIVHRSRWVAWAAVLLVVLYLLRRGAARRVRRRTSDGPAGDVGLIPEPAQSDPRRRPIVYAALASWLLVTVLPAAQLELDGRGARHDADGSRIAVELSTHMIGGQLATSTRLQALQGAVLDSQRALSRQLSALDLDDSGQAALGRAEADAAADWYAVVDKMMAPPADETGLSTDVVAILTSGPADWNRLLMKQNEAVQRSSTYGRASDLIALAIILAALTGILATGAALGDRPDRRLRATTYALLAASAAATLAAGATVAMG